MKKHLFLLAAVVLVAGGCPNDGGINLTGKNSITLHNDWTYNITQFSMDRVGDVVEVQSKSIYGKDMGINILPEPLAPGGTFTVSDLNDGRYNLCVTYVDISQAGLHGSITHYLTKEATQSIEGGRNYDYYFRANEKCADAESIFERGAPTARALLDCLLGR